MEYTQIYQQIYSALLKDNVDPTAIVGPAKRITDALWELKIITALPNFEIPNTIATAKSIIDNRFE